MPLQDSDNFIVGRGTDSYKITYQDLKDDLNYVPPPVGTIDKPTVLSPSDGAGSGATRDIVTDKITAVDNTGGSYTCETDTITDVSASVSTESLYVMNTLPISLQDVFDKGTHWESGDPLSVDDYIIRVNNEGIKDSGYLFATNPTGDIGLKGGSEEGGSYDAAGNILADKVQSYTPAEWTLLAFSANAPDPNDFSIPGGYYSFYTHPSVAYQVFRLYGSGPDNDTGVTIAESVTSKTLTLASDKDLDCFEPGDVVQGVDESNTYKTYSPSNFNLPPTTLSSDWSLVEETSISAGPQASALSPIWIYEFPSSLRHVKIGYFGSNTNFVIRVWGSNDAMTWTSLDCQLTGTTKTLDTGSTAYRYLCLAKLSETGEVDKCSLSSQITSAAMNMANTSYGVLSNQSAPVKIVSVKDDAAPYQITVDGGEWSDGTSEPGTDQSELWSANLSSPRGINSGFPALQAFNNDLTNDCRVVGGNTDDSTPNNYLLYTGTLQTNVTKLEVQLLKTGDSTYPTQEISGDGIVTTSLLGGNAGQDWQNVPLNNTTVANLKIHQNNLPGIAGSAAAAGAALCAIRINGSTVLKDAVGDSTVTGKTTSWNSSLTVAGTKDLDVLNVGDVVKMGMDADIPYQPVSDAITNVDDNESAWNQSQPWSSGLSASPSFTDPKVDAFNGTYIEDAEGQNLFDGAASAAGGSLTLNINVSNTGPMEILGYPNNFQYSSSNQTVTTDQGFSSSQTFGWIKVADDASTVSTITIQNNTNNAAGLQAVRVDGKPLVDQGIAGAPTTGNTVLTLAGDTDLAYFREGDVVQDPNAQSIQTITLSSDSNSYGVALYWITVDGKFVDDSIASYEGVPNVFGTGWSNNTTKSGDNRIEAVNNIVTITFDPPVPNGHVEFCVSGPTDGRGAIQINGKECPRWNTNNPAGLTTPDFTFTTDPEVKIVSISEPGDTNHPSITVDGGEWSGTDGSGEQGWNQGQVWSTTVTSSNTNYQGGFPYTQIWNGKVPDGNDFTSFAALGGDTPTETTLTFTGLSVNKTFAIVAGSGATDSSSTLTYDINNGQFTGNIQANSTNPITTTVTTGNTSISTVKLVSTDGLRQYEYQADGKTLVDQGVAGAPDPGDTEVTCVSPLKAPTDWKVERIEGTTIDVSHATPDDNAQVWVADDNQAGTEFFVSGPQVVDEPLLTADVELESSLFSTTPDDADTLKNIVWELNGVEQDAGTTNPYKPTLSTDTTYTVRVKHEGNTLDESPWSDQITFTTGSTRNIYTYYKERVQQLESRLTGIESNEVIDDATDTALLSLIAGLAQRIQTLEESN